MLGLTPIKTDLLLVTAIALLLLLLLYNHFRLDRRQRETARVVDLDIAELIVGVKNELLKAQQHRVQENELPLFEVKDFDLEINFVVRSQSNVTGQLDAKVITVGGEDEYSSEKVHKISLHLTAVSPVPSTGGASRERIPSEGGRVLGPTPSSLTPNKERENR